MQFKSCVAALMVVGAGVLAFAQAKVTTPEELDKAMKALGQANMAAGKAITSGDFAEGAKQLAVVKKALDDTREFCREHGYVLTLFGRKCANGPSWTAWPTWLWFNTQYGLIWQRSPTLESSMTTPTSEST